MIITRKHLFSLFLHLPGLRLPDMVQLLDHQFFAENMHIRFRTLKFCDCFVGNRLKSTEEFQVDGIQLTAACWMQLQTALFSARNRLQKKAKLIMSVNQLTCFLKNLKKCQKKFRLILEHSSRKLANPQNLRTINTFSTQANAVVPTLTPLKKCLGLWNNT